MHERPQMKNYKPRLRLSEREGVVSVEFAIILPLFVSLVMGMIEFGTALNASQRMVTAAKSGARFAAMDWTDKLAAGESPNEKVIRDVRNFLIASGLPGNQATISLTHADGGNAGQPFDLSDESNDLSLFKVEVELPFNDIAALPASFLADSSLSEVVVHRAGRATLSN